MDILLVLNPAHRNCLVDGTQPVVDETPLPQDELNLGACRVMTEDATHPRVDLHDMLNAIAHQTLAQPIDLYHTLYD